MDNKQLNDYVTMNRILNEQNSEKQKHMMDVFWHQKTTEKENEQNRKK